MFRMQWGRGVAKTFSSHTTDIKMIYVGLEVSGAVRANVFYGTGVRGLGTAASIWVELIQF
jgi:hypothetical protein